MHSISSKAEMCKHTDPQIYNKAVQNGQLDILKYLHQEGCSWDKETCRIASKYGQLLCLDYLHKNGCEWDSLSFAAANGIQDL